MTPLVVLLACAGDSSGPHRTEPEPTPRPELPCKSERFFRDGDGDGVGRRDETATGCEAPTGFVAVAGDCDDTDATVFPGALELCDGRDSDCDGDVDEGVSGPWFPDADGDGYGDPWGQVVACDAGTGWLRRGGDCDDGDPAVHPAGARQFVEVTAEAGLGFVQWDLEADPRQCVNDPMAGGAAVGDVDGDGLPDLFFPRMYSPDLLFLNQGDGTFAEVGAAAGVDWAGSSGGAVFVDVDGDGALDLFVTGIAHEGHRLYLNDGTGAFREEAGPRGVADPVSTPYTCGFDLSASAGDADGDGDLDLHVTAWQEEDDASSPRARLFLNDGAGIFTDGTGAAGLDLSDRASFTSAFADVDDDGATDLLITADWGGSGLWLGDGAGHFAEAVGAGVGTDENGMGSAIGDPDGDGDPDWFVSAIYDEAVPCPEGWGCSGNRLYRNEGGGLFSDITDLAGVRDGHWGWGAAFFDYDLDGHEDLVQAGGFPIPEFSGLPARLWHNRGDGTFEESACATGLVDVGQGRAVVPVDYDLDGDLDLFLVGHGELPSLWRNDGPAEHWLEVRVQGPVPQGLGARVQVTAEAAGPRQSRWIHANSTFGATAPALAHFGLGSDASVAELTVTWPDGTVRTWTDLAADQRFVAAP